MRRGYTLVEMVIVLALIVILAGLTIPSLQTMYGDYILQSGVDQVRAQWAAMRARAINEGRPYRFAVAPGGGAFRVAPDSSEFWGGVSPPPGLAADAPLIVEDTLPKGIRFVSGDSFDPGQNNAFADPVPPAGGDWTPVAVFLADGTARDDVDIVFQARNCTPIRLKLRSLTGGVTARQVRPDGSSR